MLSFFYWFCFFIQSYETSIMPYWRLFFKRGVPKVPRTPSLEGSWMWYIPDEERGQYSQGCIHLGLRPRLRVSSHPISSEVAWLLSPTQNNNTNHHHHHHHSSCENLSLDSPYVKFLYSRNITSFLSSINLCIWILDVH